MHRQTVCGVVPGAMIKEGSDSFIIAGAFELNKFIAPVNPSSLEIKCYGGYKCF